jgi:amidohydrolase
MDSLSTAAQALHDETIALRRDFHKHPELAFQEERTSAEIARYLRDLGLEPRTGIGGTGVTAVLEGGVPGRTVLVRADIDALPIHEENDAPYASRTAGMMHACGHDGHAAVVLTVAKILTARRETLPGRILFVFQPAEEIVRGAEAMLADGALDDMTPDVSIGLHLLSSDPVGTVSLSAGPVMAATDTFHVIVRGSGGHAAKPHQTVDPIVAASQFVTALQTLVSREVDPLAQAVFSVTSIQGGSAYNIIPEQVELKGTMRSFDAALRTRLRERFHEVAAGIGRASGATLDAGWTEGTPAVVNDERVTARVREIAIEQLGAARVGPATPTMGGDDMALWLQRAPGCYFFVGSGNEATGVTAPHHHPEFDIDEAALSIATSLLAAAAWSLAGE